LPVVFTACVYAKEEEGTLATPQITTDYPDLGIINLWNNNGP